MDNVTFKVSVIGSNEFCEKAQKFIEQDQQLTCDFTCLTSFKEYESRFRKDVPDAVICSSDLLDSQKGNILSITRERHAYLPVIFVKKNLNEDDEITFILNGASEVLDADKLEKLAKVLKKELAKYQNHKKSDHNHSRSYNLAKIGHWEIDLISNSIYWSEWVRKIFEVDEDFQPTLQNGLNFYLNKDKDFVTDVISRIIREGGTYEFEKEIETAKGNQKFIKVVGYSTRYNGQTTKIYGTTQDITQIKENERNLKETQKFYELAVEGAEVGLWEVDLETYDTFYSPTFYGMLGYNKSDVTFTKDFHNSIIHPFDHVTIEEHMENIISGKETSFEEIIRLKNKKGEYRYILDRAKVVSYAEGKAKKLAGSHIDITDQIVADIDSKNHLHRLELLIEASPVAIFQANENGKIVDIWNKAAEEIFGYTAKEAFGMTFDSIVELSKEDIKLIKEVKKGRSIKNKKITCIDRLGKERVLEVSTGPIFDTHHNLNQTLVITTDLT